MAMIVAVVDGQGGGIDSAIIQIMRQRLDQDIEVWALGTNAVATAQMMRAGANRGATGEQATIQGVGKGAGGPGPHQHHPGPLLHGRNDPGHGCGGGQLAGPEAALPLNQEDVNVVGVQRQPLPHHVEALMEKILEVQANV